MSARAPLTLPELVDIFVRTGSLAFGGGASTLAMLAFLNPGASTKSE